jgi:hypothetical protein
VTSKVHTLFCILFLTTAACGEVVTQSLDDTPAADEVPASSTAFVFATDFASSGQLYLARLVDATTSLSNTGVTLLGSSAQVRYAGGRVYVLHDGFSAVSSDNLQILDATDDFATLGQYSTGNGTNPHDVVVDGDIAYISLYNPTADTDNVDVGGDPGDVIAMDTDDGSIIARFSFADYLDDDGDPNANADQMVRVGDMLYVCLQDLESSSFAAVSPGLIGMIDLENRVVAGVIELAGRNPVSITASPDGERLYVANMATYEFALGDFDTDEPYGGIEVVAVDARATALFIDDEEFGGYVERVTASADEVFAVVSDLEPVTFTYSSRVLAFPFAIDDTDDVTVFDDSGNDVRAIAVSGDHLWVSRRVIDDNGASDPEIVVYDLATGETVGEALTPAVPGTSMSGL